MSDMKPADNDKRNRNRILHPSVTDIQFSNPLKSKFIATLRCLTYKGRIILEAQD
jgi:hypothetical protein